MCKSLNLALAVVTLALAANAALAQGRDRVQLGQLTCGISGGIGLIVGSQRALNCTFTPAAGGPVEIYEGTLTKIGVNIGVTTGGELTWTVFAPTSRPAGALAGDYAGASAEATVGAGVGANVLIGGSDRSVALQPLSLQGQLGLNLAAGVAGINLRWVR